MINIYVIETMKVENEKRETEIHGINPQIEILKDELEKKKYKNHGEEVFYYDVNDGLSKEDEEKIHSLLESTSEIEVKEVYQEPKSLDEEVTWAHVEYNNYFYDEADYFDYKEKWPGPDEQRENREAYDEEYEEENLDMEICHGTVREYLDDTDPAKTSFVGEKKRVEEKIYTRQICTVGKDIPQEIAGYQCRQLDKEHRPILEAFTRDNNVSWMNEYKFSWRVADEVAKHTTEDLYKDLSEEEKKAKMEKIAREITNNIAAKTGDKDYLSLRTAFVVESMQDKENMDKLVEMVEEKAPTRER